MPVTDNIPTTQIYKRNRLLRQLRRNASGSRLELARRLRISNSLVCDLVDQMLEEGLLLEQHDGQDRRGRRGVPVRLNCQYGHMVGFDMEAKRMRLVVVDFAGQTVWQARQNLSAPKTRRTLANRIVSFIDKGLKEIRPRYRNLLGIGLAATGVIDVKRGVILHYEMMEAARDFPLRDIVASKVDLPCVMEDNIRALTLAEWIDGAAQHLESFICLAIRSGVGAGIVINGRLHTGSHGLSAEAGFMTLPTGPGSSQWKWLQHVVSETALNVDVESKSFSLTPSKAKRAGELLGSQLATMATLLDPQAIVLAGGLLNPDGPLWDHAARVFRRMVMPQLVDYVQLLPAKLGPFAAAVGATHRCFQMLYPIDHTEC